MQLRCTSTTSLQRTGVLFKVRCGVTSELESPQLAVPMIAFRPFPHTPKWPVQAGFETGLQVLIRRSVCIVIHPGTQLRPGFHQRDSEPRLRQCVRCDPPTGAAANHNYIKGLTSHLKIASVLALDCKRVRGVKTAVIATGSFSSMELSAVTGNLPPNQRLWNGTDHPNRPYGEICCCRDLFPITDQSITQTVLERAEPALVVPPLEEPVAENGLPDLL